MATSFVGSLPLSSLVAQARSSNESRPVAPPACTSAKSFPILVTTPSITSPSLSCDGRIGNRRFERGKIDGSHWSAPSLPLIQFTEAVQDGRFGRPLHVDIERREDFQTAFIDHRFAELRDQQLADIFDIVGPQVLAAGTAKIEFFRNGLLSLRWFDKSRLLHAKQNMLLTLFCAIVGFEGRIVVRGLRQPGQECRFGQGKRR